MKFNIKSKKGFTLIELLVVIGILAVLAAIAIPSVAGLIDRANVSADNSNATAMTNAIEQFTSEFELVKQDIASGTLDETDLDSVQGRIFNIFEITMRSQVVHLENEDGINGYGVNINTKYPVNEKTFKSVITHYLKTTSDTFIPKQSDKAFYYSPEIGIVIVAEDGSTTDELNKIALVDEDGVSVNNKGFVTLSVTPLADDIEDNNVQWINLTLNALNEKNGATTTNVYVSTDTKNQYTTLRKNVLGYQEYDSEGSGLFVPGTDEYIKISVNGKQVDATWRNLIQGDYIRVVNGELENGSRAREMSGELVIGSEISNIISKEWNSGNNFLEGTRVTSVVLKEGITKIGTGAFRDANNLKTIYLPSTLSQLGGTFRCNSLERIIVAEGNKYFALDDCGVLYSSDYSTLYCYPCAKPEKTYRLHENTKTIIGAAFDDIKYLETLYFNDGLETVSYQAFENAYGLKDIYFNNKCSIAASAFRGYLAPNYHFENGSANYKLYDGCIYTYDMSTVIAAGKQSDGAIEIYDGTTEIYNIYASASGANTLIIPKSVVRINQYSFSTFIKNIYYEGSKEEFDAIQEIGSEANIMGEAIEKANIVYNYNP